MYTVYMQHGTSFYNVDQMIIIDVLPLYFHFDYTRPHSNSIPNLLMEKNKTSIEEVIAAIHNAKEKSEQNGVPVILDLTDGTPIIKYPNKTGFK